MRRDGNLTAFVLVQQDRQTQAPGTARLKLPEQKIHAVPRVHDVLHDEHVLALKRNLHVLGEGDRLRAFRSRAVAGETHEIQLRLAGQMFDEIGKEHERTLEHAHDHKRLVLVQRADLVGQLPDALLDGLFADQRFEFRNTHEKTLL